MRFRPLLPRRKILQSAGRECARFLQCGRDIALSEFGFSAGNHRLVTDVHTVEDSEREVQRYAERGQVFQTISNQHADGIARLAGGFKLRSFFPTAAVVAAAGFLFPAKETDQKDRECYYHDACRRESLPIHVHVRIQEVCRFGRRGVMRCRQIRS